MLHGMGHTAEVWRGLIGLLDGRGWLAVDLPGHGRSPWSTAYSFDGIAASVAALLPAGRPVLAVGHSMGGVIALALAAGRPEVYGVLGFGIKVVWTEDELAAMRNRAAKPPRVFDGVGEAVAAFLRFGGLDGPDGAVVSPDSALARSGVAVTEGGYRLAADPRTMTVGAPDMPALLSAARASATVVLARGEHDHMVSADALRAVDAGAVMVPDVGHNFHLTHPWLVRELADFVRGAR